MKSEQTFWSRTTNWQPNDPGSLGEDADLLLIFASTELLSDETLTTPLCQAYPNAKIIGCSTAGEIRDTLVSDDTIVVTAIAFEHSQVIGKLVEINDAEQSYQAGEQLAQSISHDGLVHAFVLSDGLNVNGSELVKGLTTNLPQGVTVTGGLAGDAGRFERTVVFWDGAARNNAVVILGLYGDRLKVGYGSLGGWDPFGPERLITRSSGNVLFELDGQSALDLYKQYLGDHAAGLPATGLLFPITLRTQEADTPVVRTILAVDENEKSMTFAGDVPEGTYARLMKANFNRLVDGAINAAQTSYQAIDEAPAELAILISCVGRKMVLKQRIEEEVEGVRDVLGEQAVMTGFYSYGEISPFTPGAKCELHNQTMTITTFTEV